MRLLRAATWVLLLLAVPCSFLAQTTNKTSTVKKKKKKTRRIPKGPPVSAQARSEASEEVSGMLERTAGIPIENPAAMVPFFEQLRRTKSGETSGPLSILHYGDSHTAADEWTRSVRALLQAQFGDGGAGYSLAGRPFRGYRRMDLKSGESRGWHSEGLLTRGGDGFYGLGGVSISTTLRGQSIYLEADCNRMELFYLQQPGGGELQLYDNRSAAGKIATGGQLGPGYFEYHAAPRPHRFELRNLARAPVRGFA